MKTPIGIDKSDVSLVRNTGAIAVDAQLTRLRNAKTLSEIGGALKRLASELPSKGPQTTPGLAPAFASAMQSRPGGVRPLVGAADSKGVKLFCGQSTPAAVKTRATAQGYDVGDNAFQLFSTGDPFTFLGVPPDDKAGIKAKPEDVKNRNVVVFQGDENYTPAEGDEKFDLPTLVAESLQIAFAAKANGAKRTEVILPQSLDPKVHPDNQLAQLVSRLAKATGVDSVRYDARLVRPSNDQRTTRTVRAGLPALGPKTKEVEKWLATLGAAQDLGAVSRSLTQLDMALTGLKGKYADHAAVLGQQVADVLAERVTALVPGLPGGIGGTQDGRTVVFAGQSNPELSADLASTLGAQLGDTAVEFHGDSPYAHIGADVSGRPAVVVQTTRQDPYTADADRNSTMGLLVEALMLCDEAKKAGASDTTLVLPYMPNARSDKVDQKGVGAYAALVARWVDELDLGKVVVVEPHDIHVPAFFRTPTRVISGAEVLCRSAVEELGRDDLVLVRPDEGATKRTKALGKDLDLPVVNGEKTRSDNSEDAKVEGMGSKSDVDGKVCLVSDDEIATGGTMRQTIAALKDNGAKDVHLAVSHANMPVDADARHESMRKLRDAGADSLYLLDTQPVGRLPQDLVGFVKVISIASAIAEEV